MLIRALPLVQRSVPDAAVLLVGDGPMRDRLVRRASELGVAKDVVFAGSKPWAELPPYFAAGDVFCMPTRTRKRGFEVEGLGIVYLEASATGLPVIAGASGGAPDAVLNGKTGAVVDGNRPEQVAEAIASLFLDPETSRAWGAAGRSWVEATGQWDELGTRLRGLLEGPDDVIWSPGARR
jgi:phosphatidyl-myo-inositol dimannoside synthase